MGRTLQYEILYIIFKMISRVNIVILAAIISTLWSGSLAKVAPDFIQICPGLKSDCLKDNIQRTIPHFVKGIPSLGVNSSDPLYLDYLKFDLAGGLQIEFFNGTLTGLRKCIVDSIQIDNFVADLKVHCDLHIKGKYRATGKVLLFTLNGEGDAKVKAKNIRVEAKILFEDKIRDGIEYREVKNIKTNYTFEDRVSFVFTNLFKESPELSQSILDFLNENWKQVLEEFGKPMIDPVLDYLLLALLGIFSK